jgi:hypothetical protein
VAETHNVALVDEGDGEKGGSNESFVEGRKRKRWCADGTQVGVECLETVTSKFITKSVVCLVEEASVLAAIDKEVIRERMLLKQVYSMHKITLEGEGG